MWLELSFTVCMASLWKHHFMVGKQKLLTYQCHKRERSDLKWNKKRICWDLLISSSDRQWEVFRATSVDCEGSRSEMKLVTSGLFSCNLRELSLSGFPQSDTCVYKHKLDSYSVRLLQISAPTTSRFHWCQSDYTSSFSCRPWACNC